MSTATKTRKTAQKVTPYGPKHIVEAEWWRQAGRHFGKTAEQYGVYRETVSDWAAAEGWQEWADKRDAEDAEEMRLIALSAATKHSREMDALIAGTRALAQAKYFDIEARLSGEIEQSTMLRVDDDELLTLAKMVQAASAVGASKYGAAPVTSVNVQIDTTQAAEQAKDRLQQWLKEHRALPGEARA